MRVQVVTWFEGPKVPPFEADWVPRKGEWLTVNGQGGVPRLKVVRVMYDVVAPTDGYGRATMVAYVHCEPVDDDWRGPGKRDPQRRKTDSDYEEPWANS